MKKGLRHYIVNVFFGNIKITSLKACPDEKGIATVFPPFQHDVFEYLEV